MDNKNGTEAVVDTGAPLFVGSETSNVKVIAYVAKLFVDIKAVQRSFLSFTVYFNDYT